MTPEELANRQFALQKAIDVAGYNGLDAAGIVESAEVFLDFLQNAITNSKMPSQFKSAYDEVPF